MKENMISEILSPIVNLIEEAKNENWDLIDSNLIPELIENKNPNLLAKELLSYVDDEDSNVRDVVATGLLGLDITDEEILEDSINKMVKMSKDEEKFPAGRAAVFLTKYKNDGDYSTQIEIALEDFKKMVADNNWTEDLQENIPQMESILDIQ